VPPKKALSEIGLPLLAVDDASKDANPIPPDTDITFGAGNLEFYRTKWRGDRLLRSS
jgi:hypothetical protein